MCGTVKGWIKYNSKWLLEKCDVSPEALETFGSFWKNIPISFEIQITKENL